MTTALAVAAASNATAPADAKAPVEGTESKVDAKATEVPAVDAAKVAAEKAQAELDAKPFTDVKQLKLAEGVKLDEAALKEFLPLAGKLGLTAKQAQALIEYSQATDANRSKATEEAREAAAQASVEALKSDKDIGGANFEKSMALAGKALKAFATPELSKALNEVRLEDGTLLGDSLVFAKFLVHAGSKVSEDGVGGSVAGGSRKTAANDPKTLHQTLYPNSPGLT